MTVLKATIRQLTEENKLLWRLLLPLILLRRLIMRRRAARVYGFYERFFKLVEGGSLIVSLPGFHGAFEFDARSHVLRRIMIEGCYEPELLQIVRDHINPEKDILDIGANVGLYTVFFAQIIGKTRKVLSVEPTPLAIRYLRQNLNRNGVLSRTIVFQGVATDKSGVYKLNVVPGREEYSSMGNRVFRSIRDLRSQSIEVSGNTIDQLVSEHQLEPGLIKIDAEGAEFLVLTGALETIRKYKPVIIAELSNHLLVGLGATEQDVIDLLQSNGYRVIRLWSLGEILAVPSTQG